MKKLVYIALAFVMLVQVTGCKKFEADINVNPNLPSKGSNAQLLTYAITQMQYTIETPYAILFSQQLSEKIYTDASRYTTINFDFDWIYSGALINLQRILNSETFNINDGSENNQLAVARILRAYYFWHITDRWGDVPYSEALQGKANFTPKYDSQKDIYYDLMKELKEAAAQIDNGNPVAGDILYDGDMDNWRMLANSMRMLMALRLSKIDPDKGKTEFADALSAGVFSDNTQNAVYRHIAESANENYWYNVFDVLNRQWYCISKTLVDYMKPLNDPRLPTFADPASASGDYVGMPYGLDGNDAGNIQSTSVSFLGQKIRTQDAPSYMITYAEVLFAEAEAAKLGWIPGADAEAEADYDAAIEASVRQWNNDDITGLSAYLLQPDIIYNPANAFMQIGYQRWVHLYMNGYEAWAEWRRTGYPTLIPAPDNTGIQIPRREAYPSSEPNINPTNYKNAIAAQPGFNGKDDLNGRVWWDKP